MQRHLPDLPYSKDDLGKFLGASTLAAHHGKHHRSYVDKLNKLQAGTAFEDLNLFGVVAAADGGLYQNAAQHLNHSLYWRTIVPGQRGFPQGRLAHALERDFGSLDAFREQFLEKAKGLFGSGWCWLSKTGEDTLRIDAMPNADGPWTIDATPVLVCDVWEHAYYLDYKNKRGRYVRAFLDSIDWGFAKRCFENPAGIEVEILGEVAFQG